MFYCYDLGGDSFQYYLLPYYHQYFKGTLSLINDLKETVDPKWNEEQMASYLRFLQDFQEYILSYICVLPPIIPTVFDLNVFEQAMLDYGDKINLTGFKLYQVQVDYIIKTSNQLKPKKKKVKQKISELKDNEREQEEIEYRDRNKSFEGGRPL